MRTALSLFSGAGGWDLGARMADLRMWTRETYPEVVAQAAAHRRALAEAGA